MKTKTGDLKLSDLSENMKNILTVLLDGKTRSTNQLADVVLQLDRVQESLVAVLDHTSRRQRHLSLLLGR